MLLLKISHLFEVCVCVCCTQTPVSYSLCVELRGLLVGVIFFLLPSVSGIELWSLSLLAGALSPGTSSQATDPSFLYVEWKNAEVGFESCLAGARDSKNKVRMRRNCSLECINF